LTGKLLVDLTKHPAVPRLLAKNMQSAVERLVRSLIKPNLAKVNRVSNNSLRQKATSR